MPTNVSSNFKRWVNRSWPKNSVKNCSGNCLDQDLKPNLNESSICLKPWLEEFPAWLQRWKRGGEARGWGRDQWLDGQANPHHPWHSNGRWNEIIIHEDIFYYMFILVMMIGEPPKQIFGKSWEFGPWRVGWGVWPNPNFYKSLFLWHNGPFFA